MRPFRWLAQSLWSAILRVSANSLSCQADDEAGGLTQTLSVSVCGCRALANALVTHGLLQSCCAGLGLLSIDDIMQHIVMSCKIALALQ